MSQLIVHDVLRSPSQPLDQATRAFFEPRFGHDFSDVRVHTGSRAAESARSIDALAYTVGQDVVFGAGQYKPETYAGRTLLSHELSHVIQQSPGLMPSSLPKESDHLEAGAKSASEHVMHDNPITPSFRFQPYWRSQAGQANHNLSAFLQRQGGSASGYTPPPGSPYSSMPMDLRVLLRNSFNDRIQGVAGSQNNLDNAYWGGSNLPASGMLWTIWA